MTRIGLYGHIVDLRRDKDYEALKEYLQAGLSYLSSRGVITNYENPPTSILVGNIPTKVKTKNGHIFASFREKIEGKDTIVMDESLPKTERIYQMMHELIHGLYPKDSENQIQRKTADCLNTLAKENELFASPHNEQNFRNLGISRTLLSRQDFERAYNDLVDTGVYGIQQTHKKIDFSRGLEGIIKGTSLSIMAAGFITSLIFTALGLSGNLHESLMTGAVIGSSTTTNYGILGIILFGILTAIIILRIRK